MLIEGVFLSKFPEKIIHKFYVKDAKENITIFLKNCVFEHVIVTLKDPKGRIRGTFTLKTYNRVYTIFKESSRTSNLFKEGDLDKGEWTLTLIKNYDCRGKYSIEILEDMRIYHGEDYREIQEISTKGEKGWYLGELHCHTNFSDGKISQLEVYNGYKEKKLDYLFITDHNVISNRVINRDWNFFSGTELTLDNNGHFNIYGVEFIDYEKLFKENQDPCKNVEEILVEMKEKKESLISLNHPFQNNTGLKYNLPMELFHTIELINCPYKEKEEMINKSISAFDYLWSKGYKIFGVAGSDTHKGIKGYKTTVGIPKNATYLEKGLNQKEILDALKYGKNYITLEEEIDINIFSLKREYTLGDEIEEEVTYLIKSQEEILWRGFLNGEKIYSEKNKEFKIKIKLNHGENFRVEGHNIDGGIRYFLNPIYNKVGVVEDISWYDVENHINKGE